MSWAGIASNQTVSFNNLQNAVSTNVFTQKNAIPASNEQITKADADFYVNINTSYAPYAAKASNQLVVKSDLQASTPVVSYPFTIWYDQPCYWDGFFVEGGAATDSDACVLNTNSIVLYGNAPTLANGMSLYYDSALTNRWYGNQGGCGNFYRYGTETFMYLDVLSTVQSLTSCCTADLNISAIYTGLTQVQMVMMLSAPQPTNVILTFTWCTDSGASGWTNIYIIAGQSGPLYGIPFDLSRTGPTTGGTSWGSQEVDVSVASSGIVNDFFVCSTSISITGMLPSCLSYNAGCGC
jgi:hypothetical protein